MLYSEFIENTGCKASEYNYQVYKNLEVMYMNSDISKEVIYEYGKKLVDNSKSQAVIEFEEGITKKIEEKKKIIEDNKWSIEYYNNLLNDSHYYLTDSEKLTYKRHIKSYKLDNRSLRNEIRSLKDMITA